MIYENEVLIQGKIVHKYVNGKVTIITISTGRTGRIINYPKAVFFNDDVPECADFEMYDTVTVTGNVQSSVRRGEDRVRVSQSIYGETIKEAPKIMEKEFGINDGDYEGPLNKVKMAGEITSIEETAKGVVRMNLKTLKNGRTSNVRMFSFTNDVEALLERIKRGSNACVIATVQTSKKERNGEPVYYENIVVQSIEAVE